MHVVRHPAWMRLMIGASVVALGSAAQPAFAQTAAPAKAAAPSDEVQADEIVVSGIRASLIVTSAKGRRLPFADSDQILTWCC